MAKTSKEYRDERIRKGLCTLCGKPKTRKGRECSKCAKKRLEYTKQYMSDPQRKQQHADKNKQLRRQRKIDIFNHYGGFICACCGETREPFLTIDHIDNNGYIHRQELGSGGTRLYTWIVSNNYPPGFRVLCCNCNFGRFRNAGVCPHIDVTNFPV